MRFKLTFVQRVVLTVAVPAIAISLLWPISWEASMTRVRGGVVERFTGTVFLRDGALVQLAGIAAILGWMYALCLRRSLWAADSSLSSRSSRPAPQAPPAAERHRRG